MRLYTHEFTKALRDRGCKLSNVTAIWWANRYGLALKFGGRWRFDARAVDMLADGMHPSEVGKRIERLDQEAA